LPEGVHSIAMGKRTTHAAILLGLLIGAGLVGYTEAIDYAAWADGWGVDIGDETNDYDQDGLLNVSEFGLNGDPTNALDQGTSPVFGIVNVGGSNVASYIHPQRSGPESGLAYSLELNTDLVDGNWSNGGYAVTGTNVTGSTLDFVSNVTDTVVDRKFIRLVIGYTPSFNVKDYGALGDGNADDTAAILSAISAADAVGSSAEVVFPAGSYRISSTNEHALQLYNITEVRLKGYGPNSVLLVSNPENGAIAFTDSTNVAVQGLVLDYETLPFAQGTITAVNTGAGTFDLQIDPGYPELSHPAFSAADMHWGLTVDLAREAYGLWAYFTSSWTDLGGRKWRMTADDPAFLQAHPLQVGDRFAHMARTWSNYAILGDYCVGIIVKDVTVHASAGLTTGFFYSSGVVVDGLRVELKPGSNRLISTNGDAVHSAGCSDGLLIENCNFVGMPDDGINIHGRGGPMISNVTDTVKWVGMQRQAFYAAGDEIQILNNAAGGIRGNAILLNAVRLNDFVWELTLDRPMPDVFADPAWVNGDKLNHISRCGQGSIIRNSFFGTHRGREVLIQSHDVTITNNHFRNPSLAWESVSLHNNYTYYSEGPAPYNVTIAGNTFEGGTNQWSWSSPMVGIHSTLPGGIQSPTYDSTNVVISGNTFINIDGPAVGVSSASDVKILNNTVTTDPGIKVASSPVVRLENANEIQIDNLDITDLNPATYAGVHIKNTVPSTSGAVVISNLTTDLAVGKPDVQDDR